MSDPGPIYQSPLKPFKPIPPRRPDLLELAIRFVCGFLVGFMASSCSYRRIGGAGPIVDMTFDEFVPGIVFGGLFGLGAMIFGDRFWNHFDRRPF